MNSVTLRGLIDSLLSDRGERFRDSGDWFFGSVQGGGGSISSTHCYYTLRSYILMPSQRWRVCICKIDGGCCINFLFDVCTSIYNYR